MSISSQAFAPRLLAGFGTAALVAGVGFFASSRPAHTAGGPIPVTVANVPLAVTTTEGQPVETYIIVTDPGGFSGDRLVYTVPAGKRLVVESMTLSAVGGDTHGYTGLVLDEDSGNNPVSLASLSAGPGTGAQSATTQPMRLHVGPGGKVVIEVTKAGTGSIGVIVSLSGYLVAA